jgi:hypothetical protein
MEHLPFLKSLGIFRFGELELIYYKEPLLSELFFPSLEKLEFFECGMLRGWKRMSGDVNDDDDDNSSQLYHISFPRLFELFIWSCPRLTHIPTFPKLEYLSFTSFRVEALEGTLNMVGSKCLTEFPPLSMLKYLEIGGCNMDVKILPKDWLQNLTSLEYLSFYELSDQDSQEIEIWFRNDPNYLPFLRKIRIRNCIDLKALPDWICNISSLHYICIENCVCLALLPEGMPRLTNLQTLEIRYCPDLIEECKTQTSATWPKIAHIPNIILKSYW